MKASNLMRSAVAATLLVLGSGAAVSGAPQAADRVLKVPCCRCVDGNKLSVAVDTGRVSGWTVTKPGSTAAQAVVPASNPGWAPVAPASWVGAPGDPRNPGVYVYEFRFEVPRCVIPGGVSIAGRFAGDNSAKLMLDGALVATNSGFKANQITNYTKTGIGPGTHVLRVEVTNIDVVTALALSGTITVACPKDPNATAAGGGATGQLASASGSCAGNCGKN
ncbi:MAG: hypothetical protein EOP61_05750 [Sphingomonadales bacterium]|nr:MAG: hypothetical protein EOP61_05750 [Sphingomonadales bacterium]